MIKLNYLVTGTGRCGTLYMAKLLSSIGIPCGHESVFTFNGYEHAKQVLNNDLPIKNSFISLLNGTEWFDPEDMQAESSYMAAPFLKTDLLKNTKIIHLVRHPFLVINSFVNAINYFKSEVPSNVWETFIYSQCPELKEPMAQYDRAALYYVLWNKKINYCDLFYRIEDLPYELFSFLGENPVEYYKDVNCNKFTQQINYKCLISNVAIKKDLINLCKKYQYNIISI